MEIIKEIKNQQKNVHQVCDLCGDEVNFSYFYGTGFCGKCVLWLVDHPRNKKEPIKITQKRFTRSKQQPEGICPGISYKTSYCSYLEKNVSYCYHRGVT